MEFNQVINNRRSMRSYTNKEVEDKKIKEIIECGQKSPSAHNLQPWKVMITKGQLKDKIAQLLIDKNKVMNDPSFIKTAEVIKQANVLLLVFLKPLSQVKDFDILSIGSFIEHMCLKSYDLGLSSLWIANTNHINDEIKELVGVNLDCISTVAIGYSDKEIKPRPRKEYDEIIIK